MPKRYGVKDKDVVVAHILDLLLSGRLRSGDRVDRNDIAATLGLSRVPIQEALGQLEHDGILVTRYHRGAFVQHFDEATLREHHEVHGLLTGAVSARAAAEPRHSVLDDLDRAMAMMRSAAGPGEYLTGGKIFRDILVDEYAGPGLTAGIRVSRNLMSQAFWASYPSGPAQLLPLAEVEIAAIRRRDPAAARRVCIDRADLMADVVITDLQHRGVFTTMHSS
ncbi:GntR family transcriptional regulator [Mycolicibacterium sp. CH28]|uniref:GntR family transcriptional regulator n=1 Tax=Mycolicibacterium sp. CH28 TaxID=2512237 RepID=UPI001081AF41|nr:GntR family transcriptional regulator [Mycolicibacterium sp. CH28]TGD84625.1 GntR family transcriptional regulator [Mycolicibacterium sp. CH28]